MSLHRPLMHHWHFPVPSLSRFRGPGSAPASSWTRASLSGSAFVQNWSQFRGSSFFSSASSSLLLRGSWFGRIGVRSSSTQSFSLQVLSSVRNKKAGAEVREGRSSRTGSIRRTHTKAPPKERPVSDMGKKARPTGPKQLSLRNVMTNPSSTISFVQILGTGMDTGDTSPCVLLFFDQRRFIFNAGEGLQRFCIEHKIKLSKIDHIFLTRVCSETAGGLPGLLLTLAGIGDAGMAVNIWGPSELKYLVDAMRTFVPGASVVHTHSFGGSVGSRNEGTKAQAEKSSEVLLEDDVVKITAVLLRSQTSLPSDKKRSKRARVEETTAESSFADESYDVSVAYVCELPEVKGRFDIEKARKFFNRPGPHYGLLQSGKSVLASDGVTMVHPEDVMDPSSPGPIFILVDCPTAAYIPALITNPVLCSFQDQGSKQVTLVVHISPASISQLPEYQSWMSRFAGAQHVMTGHGTLNMSQPVLKSSARVVSRLNRICPQVFPISGLQSSGRQDQIKDTQEKDSSLDLISVGENLLKFRLRPLSSLGLDRSAVPEPFSMQHVQDQMLLDIPELLEATNKISDFWKSTSIESVSADALVSMDEVTKYYCEEPWLMESTPVTRTNHADIVELHGENHESEVQETVAGSKSLTLNKISLEDIPPCLQGITREEMEIVFLGTGSSQPSKYRNVSAIYMHLFERGGIILDCGEGSYAQLRRRYGSQTDDVLAGLKLVWISHIHADHHTGLVRILAVRKAILEARGAFSPVLVIGPKQLKRFLDAYGQLEDLGMEFVDCSQTTYDADDIAEVEQAASRSDTEDIVETPNSSRSPEKEIATASSRIGLVRRSYSNSKTSPKKGQMRNYWLLPGANLMEGIDWSGRDKLRKTLSSLKLASLTSVPVVHCPHAFGVVLESEARTQPDGKRRKGWKIVYSGDTRPCQALVDASEGATVLIHEATFDDSMPEEAYAKKHSLTREAIETGVSAGVYRTILTHFSQRYPKIPVFDDSYTSQTCIAFDMMSVNLADLPLLPSLLPALKLLFKDDMASMEEEKEEVTEEAMVL
ncbi:tRNase Z TRZ3, mitochondrial isoform X2 [Physcomitrium patens]|uniref:ribonuclease Z n=1 Tax=Physcomitrium patens TaxID=3218 RepID=A0A2K1JG66_PHYPA|nr:tRNase Z TRZ3, mitochondrial-like isoform X2 [Physcomitrium patens]PNR40545.1 hypothetical protein PHYPA_017947 [Physcomitrium patens]|eukprot:XP_024394982.1 tRNase Z TRZ3, mitochondrial-like isoform X2 [Physcomitrella patens]